MTQTLIKKPLGEPPKYQPKELQIAVDKYFDKCAEQNIRPTVTRLCLELGFSSRQSIYDYKNRNNNQDSACIIKTALLKCQAYLDDQLLNPKVSSAGVIFALKQHGWKDKTEIEHSTGNLDSLKRIAEDVKQIEEY